MTAKLPPTTWEVRCEACGWSSGPQVSVEKARKKLKEHNNNNAHRDFDDVPLFP